MARRSVGRARQGRQRIRSCWKSIALYVEEQIKEERQTRSDEMVMLWLWWLLLLLLFLSEKKKRKEKKMTVVGL